MMTAVADMIFSLLLWIYDDRVPMNRDPGFAMSHQGDLPENHSHIYIFFLHFPSPLQIPPA